MKGFRHIDKSLTHNLYECTLDSAEGIDLSEGRCPQCDGDLYYIDYETDTLHCGEGCDGYYYPVKQIVAWRYQK